MDNTEADNRLSDDLVLSSSNSSDTEPTISNSLSLPPSSNAFVDKITLELLLNKTAYQKYLSKSEPQKFAEYQEFLENCDKHKRQMVNITCSLINNPETENFGKDLTNAFETYAKVLIRYLELKEMTDSIQAENNQEYNVRDLDEDVLFPAIMDEPVNSVSDCYSDDDLDQEPMNASVASTSFFVPPSQNGRKNGQTIQTFTMDRFFMRGSNKSNKNSY